MNNDFKSEAGSTGPIPSEIGAVITVLGLMSVLGFVVVFMNVPWEWSMFMDDTIYNSWMPKVNSITHMLKEEIASYWSLGRVYPVKYFANLLKWRYLPNDPYVFRYFNFLVFISSVVFCSLGAMRAVFGDFKRGLFPIFIFLVGSAFLHKPLLEIISINPLGETWVCFFFSLGVFFLFSTNRLFRTLFPRFFFILVALAKEPAALVFFASALRYAYLGWRKPEERKENFAQAAVDLVLFVGFLSLALYVMSQAAFTKNAYFSATPWGIYAGDFVYKLLRYSIWTSPFVVGFLLARKSLWQMFQSKAPEALAAALFFGVYGISYLVFMSTQGIVAYQEVPASLGFMGLFAVTICWLFRNADAGPIVRKYGWLLLVLFSVSYFISISRWERFVRGIVEPRRAMVNLLSTGQEMTILVPVGEITGHLRLMISELNPKAVAFDMDSNLPNKTAQFKGRVYTFEFPFYMGALDKNLLRSVEDLAGGWDSFTDAKSYRIYRGKTDFGR